MARAGILYSQVAATANRLSQHGENPTVDRVREALGNTGSKSTIAPLLKRWKTEQEGIVSEAQSGLPAELVTAVKHLYEQAQYEADQQIETMQAELAEARTLLEAQLQEVKATSLEQQRQIGALQTALTQKEAAYDELVTVNNTAQLDVARLTADNSGMALRLTDRQEEIKGLQQQLAQSRTQFAHYQEATALSRDEERRRYEHANNLLSAEAAEMRRDVITRDGAISTQLQQITSLQASVTRLEATETLYVQLQTTHNKLAQHLHTQTALAVELSNRHEVASETLLEVQKELAISNNERTRLTTSLVTLETTLRSQKMELDSLRKEKARQQKRDAADVQPISQP